MPCRGWSAPLSRRPRVYYGWWIVGVSFLTQCLTVGCVFYCFGVFFTPLIDEFGWTRAQLAFGLSLSSLCGAMAAPIIGRLVDRWGSRPLQLVGAVALGSALMALSNVQTLAQYYMVMAALLSVGAASLGQIPSTTAVAGWFIRRRGRALGVATAGISMGGVLFVPLSQFLIDAFGWRQAFVVLGLIVIVVGLPPVALLMRKAPAELPSFERAGFGGDLGIEHEIEHSVTPRDAVRDPNFWLIAFAFSLTVMGLSAVLLHQVPLLIDVGVDAKRASFALGATAGVGVLGKLGFGALLDRFDHRRVILGCFILQAFGVLLLPFARHPMVLAAYVLLYGYAMGGNATLQATIIGECFGRLHYGAIAGRMSPILIFSQALGLPLVGWLRDRTGGYDLAIVLMAMLSLLAALSISRLRPAASRLAQSSTAASRV